MRCSECAKVLRPVVAFDLDGTLGEYHLRFQLFAEEYTGHRLGSPLPFGYDQEFSEYLGMEKALYRAAKLAYRQGGMKRSMPVFPGASELVKRCRDEGAEVWVTTTRPWASLTTIDPDTRHWLGRSNIPWDYMIYGEDKYQQLVENVGSERVVAVLEDDPEYWETARGLDLRPVMKINGHANLAIRSPGVHTLEEASRELLPRIRSWRENNASAA